MKPEETIAQKSITRTEIAQWYGITERSLRYRMQKENVHISNRILTVCDIRLILKGLGRPRFMLSDLYDFFFGS